MNVVLRDASEYAAAIKGLLPPGAAWEWPAGGTGDALVLGTAQELARVDGAAQVALDAAIEAHRPGQCNFHISEYRRVVAERLAGVAEVMPRKPAAIGCGIGTRLWSHAAPLNPFPVDLFRIDHLLGPARVGSGVGCGMWGPLGRKILRVRYFKSVADPRAVWDALVAFRQAHVYLWFEDISGVGGEVSYAQD